MRTAGQFSVESFVPAPVQPSPPISTGLPVGVATMAKTYSGDVAGHSSTIFTAAFDQASGVGTYVAMDSFEGTLDGREGAFVFAHAASTAGSDRSGEYFVIVAGSGLGELAGITGGGGMSVDADGTHRVWFDYSLG